MVRMSRCKLILVGTFLAVCQAVTGCLTPGGDSPTLPRSGAGMHDGQHRNMPLLAAGNQTGAPPGTMSGVNFAANGDVRTASYNTPRANFVGQANPKAGDMVVEQPMIGMPMAAGMVSARMPLPTELNPTAHPPHKVAPPDILLIEANRLVPKGPYKLEAMEVLQIEVVGAFKDQIKGLYMISPEGTINLGFTLRPVPVAGLTIDRAQLMITEYLRTVVKGDFSVSVALVQMRGMQNVRGEHLVRPDGTIHLGMYGSVFVAGMDLGQVKCVIENHLAAYLVNPQVSVDVFAYNSRKIYIIADGAGYGQQVISLPATGNEKVLDAIARVGGLPPVSSLKKIWVARPSPAGHPCSQILPVDWKAITQAGRTETNYQLLPGDRIYIDADPAIKVYNYLDKFVAPFERLLGVTLLGSSTVQSLRGVNSGLIVAR